MRLIALVVAATGEPRLAEVLERISYWADETCVIFDGTAKMEEGDTALEWATSVGSVTSKLDVDEGRTRTHAWALMSDMLELKEEDYVFLIEPYEVVVEHDDLRARLKQAKGEAFPVLLHHMWSESAYRTDGYYRPAPFWALVPWRPGGQMRNKTVMSGREPTYVHSNAALRKSNTVVCSVLSYAHCNEDDRSRADKTFRLRTPELPNWNLVTTPVMKEWDKGGLL